MSRVLRVRAVLFDLDGTLYHQPPLRALMTAELSLLPWLTRRPDHVPRLWQTLRTFRRVREELRALGIAEEPLARLQYVEAARRAGMATAAVEAAVEEWMFRRPLKYMRWVARAEARDVLRGIRALGLEVGVFSDYPADEKLAELGLRGAVGLRLCATDPEINAFKPHPAGFLRACALWGVTPAEVMYVGDRPDVDGTGAAAAGMHPVIVGARQPADASPMTFVNSLRELPDLIARLGGTPWNNDAWDHR